ncbi:hypothetical protein C1701_26700 [Actinoalloteichus sp. AHMU CJ021]|uniref:Uncharacterized protein n=1 Tax=Actinoalloteichus caeruleus DSM 43889 TaxID=1120930 RepID=A0ABT1JEX5_ACTCY|nr:hypothetical protein [Actinoalloteichus caeruleus]AUS81314.1 hypothetical protein C1701_26700 [Actinoalloteichus sp. AHMU CJ021]MCP2330691.1 hypothetical protein [Actinoalloteichus caeruleus DSM 43889]
MADETSVDTTEVFIHNKEDREAIEDFGAAWRELCQVLDANDGCWSTDDIGKAFANKYVEPADGQVQSLEDVYEICANMSGFVPEVVELFMQIDSEGAQDLGSAIDHLRRGRPDTSG